MNNTVMQNTVMDKLEALGTKVKDKVTGHKGVVTSVSFDLYGNIQNYVQSRSKNNENEHWSDTSRLSKISKKKVMERPEFQENYTMKNAVMDSLDLLGKKAKDKVTGQEGVITLVSYDLYGCIPVIVTPQSKEDGTTGEAKWHDVNRLEIIDENRVLEPPNYEEGHIAEGLKGGFEKPMP